MKRNNKTSAEKSESTDSSPVDYFLSSKPWEKGDRWFQLAVVLCYAFYLSPLLAHFDQFSNDPDFFQHLTLAEHFRSSLCDFHQFPWRSHLLGGGAETLGLPNDPSLDPLSLFFLIADSVKGLKLLVFTTLLCSVWAIYRIMREIFLTPRAGAAMSAFVLGGVGWIPSQLMDGNYKFVTAFWVPAALWCLLRAESDRRFVFAAALSLIPPAVHGGMMLPVSMIFLALSRLAFTSWRRKDLAKAAIDIMIMTILVIALALPKFYSTWSLGKDLSTFIHFEEETSRYEVVAKNIAEFENAFRPQKYIGFLATDPTMRETMRNHDLFIGIAALLCALIGIVAAPSRLRRTLLIPLIFFIWWGMGPYAPLDLNHAIWASAYPLRYLWKIPKYVSPFIILSLAMAAGAVSFFNSRRRNLQRFIRAAVLIAYSISLIGLWTQNRPLLARVYTEKPFPYPSPAIYGQVYFPDLSQHRGRDIESIKSAVYYERQQFYQLLSGIGTINWSINAVIDAPVIPKWYGPVWPSPIYPVTKVEDLKQNENYRQEVWFQSGEGTVRDFRTTPNRIDLSVEIGAPSTIIINQAFLDHFRSNTGRLFNADGLIGLELSEPGRHSITLALARWDIIVTILISAATLIAGAVLCFFRRRDDGSMPARS